MTPNLKAKIHAWLILGAVAPITIAATQPMPKITTLVATTVLMFCVGGARDPDPATAIFHGRQLPFWVPAAVWAATAASAAWFSIDAATRWVLIGLAFLQALAMIGWIQKNQA